MTCKGIRFLLYTILYLEHLYLNHQCFLYYKYKLAYKFILIWSIFLLTFRAARGRPLGLEEAVDCPSVPAQVTFPKQNV